MKLAAKNLHKKAIDSFIICTAILVSGPIFAQDKHIDVSVVRVGDIYKMQFANSVCPERRNQKGCVLASHGSSPNISWELDEDSSGPR